MALTRAQLLMGNTSQGPVLTGQVQGVKEGPGVNIDSSGTISFDPTGLTSVVLTNNDDAYNSYVWPNLQGADATFLCTDGANNISWQAPNIGSVVSVGLQPSPSRVGRLWFDSATRTLKVFENVSNPSGQWTPVSQGVPVTSLSSSPAFTGGSGTDASPYIAPSSSTSSGSFARSAVITASGLAPYQYVPIIDTLQESNGYRFRPSNTFADGNGILTFLINFQDFPISPSGQSYGSKFKIGFGTTYVSYNVSIASALSLDSAGVISGNPQVGDTLTYAPGSASGGLPPYSYTWVWKRQSDGLVIQTNGNNLNIPASLAGDRVYVELTATDSALASVSASTAGYPLSPAVIGKAAFPNTNILFPTTIPGEIATLWLDEGTTLYSTDCVEFKVNAGSYSQGPTVIANGDTITTRWVISPTCNGAITGTTISGCVYSTAYEECGSLTIDRIPSPFTFLPVSDIIPGQVGTSQIITPMGFNSTAYVSYTGTSTATTIQASVNGGAFTALPTYGSNTLPINPGETLQVRATTGSSPSSPYTANINIGEGTSVQSTTFTINTSASGNFTTLIPFPTTTIDVPAAVTWLAGDGATTLTSTSCIEFSVNAGAFSQGPTPITTGDTITTRWNSGGSCGGAAHGTTITGTVTNVPAGGTNTNYASLTIDRVPASFSFTNLTNQATTALVTSNTLNIVGFNAPAYITYAAPPSGGSLTTVEASVAGGPWTAIPVSGTTLPINPVVSGPGNTLQIRGTTGASNNTPYGVTIQAGESTSIQATVWTATTAAVVPGVVTPSILTPVNGATNLTPYSSSPAGITITSSTYTPINGASATHASTDWEIRKGSTGGIVVVNVNSVTELTSYFLDVSSIDPNSTYFVRCRYYSGDFVPVVSSWSAWSQFSTSTTFSLTWVTRVSGSGTSIDMNDVTWIGGSTNKFVAVGTANSNSRISSDGITWANGGVVSSSDNMWAVSGGAGVYLNTLVAVGNNGTIRSSTNGGSTWGNPGGTLNSSNTFWTVACNPSGRFVAGGDNGVIRTTTNLGVTWTTVSSGTTRRINSIIWDSTSSQFIGTAGSWSSAGNERLITSPDGITWSASPSGLDTLTFTSGQILVVPGAPTRYIVLPLFDGGGNTTSYYAVSTNLSSWTQVAPITPNLLIGVHAGAVSPGFLALGSYTPGVTPPGQEPRLVSSLASASPFSFTEDAFLTFNGGVLCMAYSSGVNRFVAMGDEGYIYSTS